MACGSEREAETWERVRLGGARWGARPGGTLWESGATARGEGAARRHAVGERRDGTRYGRSAAARCGRAARRRAVWARRGGTL